MQLKNNLRNESLKIYKREILWGGILTQGGQYEYILCIIANCTKWPSDHRVTGGGVVRGDLPSPSGGTWVSMVGVGLEPSSGLRVRKKRKETTIIEVNTIYSPELLNGWDLHMARPRQIEKQTDRQIE